MTRDAAIKHLENMKWLKGYSNTTVDDIPLGSIIDDIIALLKEKEPRVMTLEEAKSLKQDTVVWYEHDGINRPRPRIVHYADDRCIVFTDGGKWQYDADGYSSHWRCWTSRPTDEQREAIPWN